MYFGSRPVPRRRDDDFVPSQCLCFVSFASRLLKKYTRCLKNTVGSFAKHVRNEKIVKEDKHELFVVLIVFSSLLP